MRGDFVCTAVLSTNVTRNRQFEANIPIIELYQNNHQQNKERAEYRTDTRCIKLRKVYFTLGCQKML